MGLLRVCGLRGGGLRVEGLGFGGLRVNWGLRLWGVEGLGHSEATKHPLVLFTNSIYFGLNVVPI